MIFSVDWRSGASSSSCWVFTSIVRKSFRGKLRSSESLFVENQRTNKQTDGRTDGIFCFFAFVETSEGPSYSVTKALYSRAFRCTRLVFFERKTFSTIQHFNFCSFGVSSFQQKFQVNISFCKRSSQKNSVFHPRLKILGFLVEQSSSLSKSAKFDILLRIHQIFAVANIFRRN